MKVLRSMWLNAAAVVLTATAIAATPSSGTLNAPTSGQTSTVTWSGGPYTGATADPSVCTTLTCDSFTVVVNVPATFYSYNPNYSIRVGINWTSSSNDFDLYLYDSSGNLIGTSAQGGTTFELIDAGQLPSGTYTVQVVTFTGVNATYNGNATLGPEPTNANGTARYKNGNFTFTAPLVLPGPPDAAFNQQGLEPRVTTDPLGNIYAAAIQGIPAGTDTWKSMDGGKSWTYLGQPDGAQAAAALGARGAGAGGGDEDLAIGSTGNVYVDSLWLGSAAQSTSLNGGATWIVNPFSTDVPLVDRQWIASDGASNLYLTYKQLGVLLSGTESIFVAKSFDGGITFPQIVEVTTPQFGVQPGDQGNIVVDKNNGYVYTSFVGQSNANTIYLARSADGGKTWGIKQVYTAANGASLANVFVITTVDAASNVYVSYSDGHNIYMTGSRDQGVTWTTPVRVSNGVSTKTALSPWIEAGQAGKVNIVWWGTNSGNNLDTTAQWKVFFAQTQDFFKNIPVFYQSAATPVMHVGAICVNGTGCASGTRNLAEYFAQGTYRDGTSLIVYPDDNNNPSPMTTFIRQTGGPIIGTK